MKVFLSWSGDRSRDAATLFRKWLPKIIQAVDPFVSSTDIEKGAQWLTEISRELGESSFGIVFVTRENLDAPWLHFEAGALAKAMASGTGVRVCTYLLGVDNADIRGPLAGFQHTQPTADDTLAMLKSINAALLMQRERALKEDILTELFSELWPSLEGPLLEIRDRQQLARKRRSAEDMLEEVLEYVRPRYSPAHLAEAIRRRAFDQGRTDITALLGDVHGAAAAGGTLDVVTPVPPPTKTGIDPQ